MTTDPEPMIPLATVKAALQRCYDTDDDTVACLIASWLNIELDEHP